MSSPVACQEKLTTGSEVLNTLLLTVAQNTM